MRLRQISCCFSGYRPDKLPWGEDESDSRCDALKERLRRAVVTACAEGYRHFIVGMAAGVDLYCCEIVQALRGEYPITVEAAVPCREQADHWPRAQQIRYRTLLAQCDDVTVLQERYTPSCMQRRNRYMVDHAARLIAVFDGCAGGTRNTVQYAMQQRLELVLLPPEE